LDLCRACGKSSASDGLQHNVFDVGSTFPRPTGPSARTELVVRNVFATVAKWLEQNRSFALGTLVALRDAATAPVGTTVAVDEHGCVFGNIGAGCYEAEIVEACVRTARDGRSRRLDIDLTIDDEVTRDTGCGAAMEVIVWRPKPAFRNVARAIAAGEHDVRLIIEDDEGNGSRVAFEQVFAPKDTLILVGATALAAEVAAIARRLDFNVVVVDPRPTFATKERIPDACEIVRAWPDDYLPRALSEHTPIVMLSHDPKFDLAGLRCALESNVPYIGLLGSRRSQAARRASLRTNGFDEGALARIHGPAGLQLGGTSVAETALSIMAELVAVRHGGDGTPLWIGRGAIHRQLERVVGRA
jgi:xanthine dehydrogenase accessory factor